MDLELLLGLLCPGNGSGLVEEPFTRYCLIMSCTLTLTLGRLGAVRGPSEPLAERNCFCISFTFGNGLGGLHNLVSSGETTSQGEEGSDRVDGCRGSTGDRGRGDGVGSMSRAFTMVSKWNKASLISISRVGEPWLEEDSLITVKLLSSTKLSSKSPLASVATKVENQKIYMIYYVFITIIPSAWVLVFCAFSSSASLAFSSSSSLILCSASALSVRLFSNKTINLLLVITPRQCACNEMAASLQMMKCLLAT